MGRLTERTDDGIAVKEEYGENVLKTIYQCYGAEPLPHYENCDEGYCAMEKLAEYEDLEEQGKLPKLPCTVDSEVWFFDKYGEPHAEIVRGIVDGYLWYRSCGFALSVVFDKPIMGHFGYKRKEMPFSEIGKTVFLTKEEAEVALQKMNEREC